MIKPKECIRKTRQQLLSRRKTWTSLEESQLKHEDTFRLFVRASFTLQLLLIIGNVVWEWPEPLYNETCRLVLVTLVVAIPDTNINLYPWIFLPGLKLILKFPQVPNVSPPVLMGRFSGGTFARWVSPQNPSCCVQMWRKILVHREECPWSMNLPCQPSSWLEQNKALCCLVIEKLNLLQRRLCVHFLNIMDLYMLCR